MAEKYIVVLYKQDGLFYRRLGECKSDDKGFPDWPALIEKHQQELSALEKKVAHHYKDAMEASTLASSYAADAELLRTTLHQILADAQEQDVLPEWRPMMEAALKTPNAGIHRAAEGRPVE